MEILGDVHDEEEAIDEDDEMKKRGTTLAPLTGSSAEIRVDGALRNLPLAVTVLVRHKLIKEKKKLQENEMFQK